MNEVITLPRMLRWTARTEPDPPQREHRVGWVPGSLPDPPQRSQDWRLRIVTVLLAPRTTSSRVTSRSTTRSLPRERAPRRCEKPKGSAPPNSDENRSNGSKPPGPPAPKGDLAVPNVS